MDHQEYDIPGGILERVRVPLEIEAWRMVRESVAEPVIVNELSRSALGLPAGLLRMVLDDGPLERADAVRDLAEASHGDGRFRPIGDLFPPTGTGSIWDTLREEPEPFADAVPGNPPAKILIVGTPHLVQLWRDRLYTSSGGRVEIDTLELWDLGSLTEAELKRVVKHGPWDLLLDVLVAPTEERRQLLDLLVSQLTRQAQVWVHTLNLPATVTVQVVPEDFVAIGFGGIPNRYGDPVIELARPRNSDVSDLVRAAGTAAAMNLTPYEVADEPGGVGARLLAILINSTSYLVREGVIASEGIADKEISRALGLEASPFVIADEIGLDTVEGVLLGLRAHLGEERYRVSPLLTMRIESGALGSGTNSGFYLP